MRNMLIGAVFVSLVVLCFSPTAGAANDMNSPACRVYFVYGNDPNPPINVRSSTEIRPDNILCTVSNGEVLSFIEQQDGWFRVKTSLTKTRDSKEGWVSSALVDWGCNSSREQVDSFPAKFKKRMPPSSEHSYSVQLEKEQILLISLERHGLGHVCDAFRLFLESSDDPATKNIKDELAFKWGRDSRFCKTSDPQTVLFQAPVTGRYQMLMETFKQWNTYDLKLDLEKD